MARYVVEWVCRSREEREAALPLAVIAHDGRGGRLVAVDLPLDLVARRMLMHPDSLRERLADWQDKMAKPLHMYDRKTERYIPVAIGDPQWLAAVCQPTLDENYFCSPIAEREGAIEAVLDEVVQELQGQYAPQLVGSA